MLPWLGNRSVMKKPVPFLWVDVFAEVPLGGNPLAVLEGVDLPEEALLPLTRELSLSESVFFYPPTVAGADAKVRIFTLAKEVPFAGHPALGAAVALLLLEKLKWTPTHLMARAWAAIGWITNVRVGGGGVKGLGVATAWASFGSSSRSVRGV